MELRADVPRRLRRIIDRAVDPRPERRYESAEALAAALGTLAPRASVIPLKYAVAFTKDQLRRAAIVVFVAGFIAALVIVVRHLREPTNQLVSSRFTIAVPDTAVGTTSVTQAQISPDGRLVAFVLRSEDTAGLGRVWMRSVQAAHADPLAGTDDARSLFWAPDSQHLAFTTASALKRLTVSDGTVETLCAACPVGRGGTWNNSGLLVIPSADGGLLGISSSGGTPASNHDARPIKGGIGTHCSSLPPRWQAISLCDSERRRQPQRPVGLSGWIDRTQVAAQG